MEESLAVLHVRKGEILLRKAATLTGLLASHLAHTVGATDGGAVLPVVNWSKQYGDLRIAHFVGVHALQLLPLFGFFIARQNRSAQLFSAVYFIFTSLLFIQAIMGVPLFFNHSFYVTNFKVKITDSIS